MEVKDKESEPTIKREDVAFLQEKLINLHLVQEFPGILDPNFLSNLLNQERKLSPTSKSNLAQLIREINKLIKDLLKDYEKDKQTDTIDNPRKLLYLKAKAKFVFNHTSRSVMELKSKLNVLNEAIVSNTDLNMDSNLKDTTINFFPEPTFIDPPCFILPGKEVNLLKNTQVPNEIYTKSLAKNFSLYNNAILNNVNPLRFMKTNITSSQYLVPSEVHHNDVVNKQSINQTNVTQHNMQQVNNSQQNIGQSNINYQNNMNNIVNQQSMKQGSYNYRNNINNNMANQRNMEQSNINNQNNIYNSNNYVNANNNPNFNQYNMPNTQRMNQNNNIYNSNNYINNPGAPIRTTNPNNNYRQYNNNQQGYDFYLRNKDNEPQNYNTNKLMQPNTPFINANFNTSHENNNNPFPYPSYKPNDNHNINNMGPRVPNTSFIKNNHPTKINSLPISAPTHESTPLYDNPSIPIVNPPMATRRNSIIYDNNSFNTLNQPLPMIVTRRNSLIYEQNNNNNTKSSIMLSNIINSVQVSPKYENFQNNLTFQDSSILIPCPPISDNNYLINNNKPPKLVSKVIKLKDKMRKPNNKKKQIRFADRSNITTNINEGKKGYNNDRKLAFIPEDKEENEFENNNSNNKDNNNNKYNIEETLLKSLSQIAPDPNNVEEGSLGSKIVQSTTKSNWNKYDDIFLVKPFGLGQITLSQSLKILECHIESIKFPVPCPFPECNNKYPNIKLIREHILNHNSSRPFNCHNCPSMFRRRQDLLRHVKIHLKMKPYSCNLCHKKFGRKDAQARHTKRKSCQINKSMSVINKD